MTYAAQMTNGNYIPLRDRNNPDSKFVVITVSEYDQLMAIKQDQSRLHETLEKKKAEVQQFRNLNDNLLRITRERANQERGITNKKEHDGYLVVSSKQCTDRYERDMTQEEYEAKDYNFRENHIFTEKCKPTITETVIAWRTVIQTPYSINLAYDNISDQILYDLLYGGILFEMDCQFLIYNGVTFKKKYNNDGKEINIAYRSLFNRDYHSGLWAVELYTTLPLIVPDNRKLSICCSPERKKK